ncbi:MAG: type VI secretion system-associated protein TagF [Nitrospirae bacterium]|nr:type VI secretion system-associated protein TagF [Candidatus Manganitrophaceae bacterium]
MSDPRLQCFGKLPIHADFIRFQTAGDEIRALDRWFQEGIHLAKSRLGNQWPSIFRDATSWRFVFQTASSPSLLVGVFMPSYDRSGRSYPFFLFLRVDKKTFGGPEYFAPLCFSHFLDEAEDILKTAWHEVELKTFLGRLQDFRVSEARDLGVIQKAYLQNLSEETGRQFWSQFFGDFKAIKKYQLNRNLIEMLQAMRGRSADAMRFGLKFPLVPEDRLHAGEEAYDIPFWFDFVSRFLNLGHNTVFFWRRDPLSASPAMLSFFSPPSAKHFLALLQPEQNNDAWFNLVSEDSIVDREEVFEGLKTEQKALLENETLSMADFLAALEKMS